jgi:membrane-associated phospholipid phosphatase
MHVAFSLMIAVPSMLIVRRPVFKVLWALYPLLVSFVVIVTGNHWLFDVFIGACVAGTSALIARHVLSRLWPAAWAWEPAVPAAAA